MFVIKFSGSPSLGKIPGARTERYREMLALFETCNVTSVKICWIYLLPRAYTAEEFNSLRTFFHLN